MGRFFSCKDIEENCDIFYAFMKDAISILTKREVFMIGSDAP